MSNTPTADRKLENVKYIFRQEARKCYTSTDRKLENVSYIHRQEAKYFLNTSTGRKPKISNTSTADRKLENVKYVHRQEATKCQIHPQAGSWKISSTSTDRFDYKDSDLTINFLKLLIFFVLDVWLFVVVVAAVFKSFFVSFLT